MIRVFGCETARELLPALVDGELGVHEQVEVETHLRSCSTCAAHVEDLRTIGDALRLGGSACDGDREMEIELRGLQAGVLGRVRAERDQSFGARLYRMFDDLHAVWAAAGAVAGVVACVLLTMSVISAIDTRASDSLAEIIDALGNPGSEKNPMSLDGRILPPRLETEDPLTDVLNAALLNSVPTDDATFALSTVVTRDGRIADYEVLGSHYPTDHGTDLHYTSTDAVLTTADVSYVREAVKRTRFSPAQCGGAPVAVNMVWLLARTTVKGSPLPFDFDEFRELRAKAVRSRS